MAFAATVVAAVFRRGSWSAPVWNEFQRVLGHVAVGSLPTTFATGLLVGFTLVSQAVYWLAQTGTTGAVGPVIAAVLVRELVPILVGLIVFGRNGTATLIELGQARINGSLRLYEVQGLDAMELLVMPRALAFAVGAFCLATVLVVSTLLTGYLVAHALGLVAYSIFDFVDLVSRSLAGARLHPAAAQVPGHRILRRHDLLRHRSHPLRRERRTAAPGAARLRAVRPRHPRRQQPVRPCMTSLPAGSILSLHGVALAGRDGTRAGTAFSLDLDRGDVAIVQVEDAGDAVSLVGLCLGLSDPANGHARFLGVHWTTRTPVERLQRRRRIGAVLQAEIWPTHLSVEESVLLGQNLPVGAAAAEVLAEATGLARTFGCPAFPVGPRETIRRATLLRAACVRGFLGGPTWW